MAVPTQISFHEMYGNVMEKIAYWDDVCMCLLHVYYVHNIYVCMYTLCVCIYAYCVYVCMYVYCTCIYVCTKNDNV